MKKKQQKNPFLTSTGHQASPLNLDKTKYTDAHWNRDVEENNSYLRIFFGTFGFVLACVFIALIVVAILAGGYHINFSFTTYIGFLVLAFALLGLLALSGWFLHKNKLRFKAYDVFFDDNYYGSAQIPAYLKNGTQIVNYLFQDQHYLKLFTRDDTTATFSQVQGDRIDIVTANRVIAIKDNKVSTELIAKAPLADIIRKYNDDELNQMGITQWDPLTVIKNSTESAKETI